MASVEEMNREAVVAIPGAQLQPALNHGLLLLVWAVFAIVFTVCVVFVRF